MASEGGDSVTGAGNRALGGAGRADCSTESPGRPYPLSRSDGGEPQSKPAVAPAEGPSLRPILLFVGLAAVAHTARFADLSHTLDDSWISFRIARNLVEHGLLTHDVTMPPVEGMTNLLWTLLSALWIGGLPEMDPIVPVRLMGSALHVAAVVVAARRVGIVVHRIGGDGGRAALLSGGLLAASGSMAFHAVGGLETPLWSLLFIGVADRLDAAWEGQPQQAWVVGGLLALLAATRPEGLLVAGMVGAMVMVVRRDLAIGVVVPAVLGVVALEAFRLAVYGSLVPNTFFAKPPWAANGLVDLSFWWRFGVGVIGPLAVVPALNRPRVRGLLTIAVVLVAGTVWSGGDWMPGHRRFTLPMVCLAMAAGIGVGVAKERWQQLLLGASVLTWTLSLAFSGFTGLDNSSFTHLPYQVLGVRLNASPGVDQVAALDIGTLGWHYRGRVLDLGGLTDAHIAREVEGRHMSKWDESYFRERKPEVALSLFHHRGPLRVPLEAEPRPRIGPEAAMVRSILKNGGYRLHSAWGLTATMSVVVFRRDDVRLPEEVWGPESPHDLRDMLSEFQGRSPIGRD